MQSGSRRFAFYSLMTSATIACFAAAPVSAQEAAGLQAESEQDVTGEDIVVTGTA